MRTLLIKVGVLSFAFAGFLLSESSWCQAYPVRPIRLVMSGPPASAPDVIMRPIAQRLSESLGQQVIVDNRPGAGGVVAAQIVANVPPDGYTVLVGSGASFSIAPFLAKKQPYDPVQDFTPVTLVVIAPLIMTVHPSFPVKSVRELIGLAKSKPKQILFASPGTGTPQHLTMEMFSRAAGISMVHVPYKGGSPAVIDTVSGQVQLVITAVPAVMSQIKISRLRALAVTSSKRLSTVPDVPTVAESGLPGFECVQWYALFAPKNTPTAIVERLYSELRKVTESPSIKSIVAQEGVELAVDGSRALAEFHRMDMARWQKVIHDLRQSNIVLE